MRQAQIYSSGVLAGTLTETDDGHYRFLYDDAFWEEAHYRFVVTDKLFENGMPL